MGTGASIPDTETLDENQCVSNEVEATKNDASDDMEVNKEIKVTEEPEKGNQKEEDTKSMDSKDSNDTYVLAWRMPKYLIEKRQRLQKEKQLEKDGQSESDNQQDPSHAKHPEKNRLAVTSDEHKDSNSVFACEPNTLTNKQETFSDANKLPKGAPCGKDRDNEAGEEQAINCSQAIETGDNECKVSNEKKSDTTVRGSAKTGTSASNTQKDKTAEKFEEFKKRYGIQLRRRKSLPNKMTLVITRVGTKFQLTTVPAYLPRQRLYRSSSFVKNYIPEEPVFGRRKSKSII